MPPACPRELPAQTICLSGPGTLVAGPVRIDYARYSGISGSMTIRCSLLLPRVENREQIVVPFVVTVAAGSLATSTVEELSPQVKVCLERLSAGFMSEIFRKKAMSATLCLKPKNSTFLLKGKDAKLTARDAKGRALPGEYDGFLSRMGHDGSLELELMFEDAPRGGWAELDAVLPLEHAKGKTVLAAQTIPVAGKGRFEAGGISFFYQCCAASPAHRGQAPQSDVCLEFPAGSPVASIQLASSKGNVNVTSSGFGRSGKTESQDGVRESQYWTIDTPDDGMVQVVITRFDEVEEFAVPLKVKFCVGGSARVEQAPVEGGK